MRRAERHRAKIEAELGSDEQVVSWVPAEDFVSATSLVPTLSGALVLTTRRVIFKGSSRRASIDRELDLTSANALEVGWHRRAVDLRFAGNPEFGKYLARSIVLATPFVAALETALAPPATPTVTELATLSDLFERGLLTAEEFATAKSRLLA